MDTINSMTSITFTPLDVQKHNKPNDVWLILHNKVYDVTAYLQDHPGGDIILKEVAGTDATEAFEEVGHSAEANDELDKLLIGHLAEEHHVDAVEVFRPVFAKVAQQAAIVVPSKKGLGPSRRQKLLLRGALGLGLATGVMLYTNNANSSQLRQHIMSVLPRFSRVLPLSSSPSSFWTGFGIASVAEVALSVAVAVWAWSKLDVQEDFTHYAARREARASAAIGPDTRKPATTRMTLVTRAKNTTVSANPSTGVLSPKDWRPFKLVRKTLVSPNVYRLVFTLPRPDAVLGLPIGQHVALRATLASGETVSRSYTPVSNDNDRGRIELLIKVYQGGRMTQHLAALPVGGTIDMRGPKGAMRYSPTYARRIGMIAGGTGITPMFQLIRAVCEDETDDTSISLIYANNTEDDILLRQELDGFALQCPHKFRVYYVVTRPLRPDTWTGGTKNKMTWTPPTIRSRPVCVLGAGVLGRRIACSLVAGGYNVTIRDPFPEARTAAIDFIRDNHEQFATAMKPTTGLPPGTYQAFPDMEAAVRDAWLVIEAVPEKIELKIETFGELATKAPPDCILGSNSSSYRSAQMLEDVADPERRKLACNIHFTMPPSIRTVELMTCGETDPAVFPFLTQILSGCGFLVATARKESTGFIFNRLWAAVKREILNILAEDVSDAAQIDALWRHMFAAEVAPCQLMDRIGLDTLYVLDVGLGNNAASLADVPTNGKIVRVDPATGHRKPIVTGLSAPDGIDVSPSLGRMFWTNMGANVSARDGSVMSAALDGSDVRTLIPAGGPVVTPKQAVFIEDSSNGPRLYFCDREGASVHRCDADGGRHEVLVRRVPAAETPTKDQTQWCVGVAVDPQAGKLYWTQKGPSKAGRGRIFRAGLDLPDNETAADRSDIELLFDNLPEPIDLELDLTGESRWLYWTDRGEHPRGSSLNRVRLDELDKSSGVGVGAKVDIVARHFHEPIGLKLDVKHHRAFVTDLGGTIYSVDLRTGAKSAVFSDDGCYTGIALLRG
ncbi:hypothetical protein QBC47DRAFT_454634 [Echria macrotheca]|uniref:cytochrome-b5 reductase n=1 Tax=Echria macrotheca TaxID=438768 RepID=A0AAJ0B469_9PEZI|nr:hypothetical protein QBC47DRAFT_454634 [Echria macrotheca]